MKKKVLIIGGSSDIGLELAKKFINQNYNLTLHYNKNLKILKNFKSNCKLIKANFTSLKINKILKKFDDDYDIIINLVGFISKRSFENFTIKTLEETLKVNSIVPMLILRMSINNMIKKKWGRITNTSSIGVKFGGGQNSYEYSLSKHFNEFIPSKLRRIAKHNIFYNVIRIGLTNTKIHKNIVNKNLHKRVALVPVKKMAEPIDIANYIYYISSIKNKFITNEVVNIVGGE